MSFATSGFTFSNSNGNHHDFDHIVQWIAQHHPGTKCVALPLFEGTNSSTPMWTQIPRILSAIRQQFPAPQKIHLLGHSQGALMLRSVIEQWDNHK